MATLREQLSVKGLWPRYANSYQLKAFGHATRTAISLWATDGATIRAACP
ncbi:MULTISPECIES: hypothetical protein [unclassified Moorena]|nr:MULTISPECIES: hypothetical protein [unclassified Moorena]NEO06138.1 hypothetical protein [Moorena sp. SIO3I8]NEP26031.1 hypothetical protein [Moorena sp. SIO3I6]